MTLICSVTSNDRIVRNIYSDSSLRCGERERVLRFESTVTVNRRHQLIQQSVIKALIFYHRHRFASTDETHSQKQRVTLVNFLLPAEVAPVLLLNLFPRLHPVDNCQLSAPN